ncbi:MAG TPA: hypothetical protein PK294_02390 [Ignavibacteria bacterium]|nr:hypothetical protein [Ignavibacteria bacterium]HQY51407.1 hypothetical protein [Ignavibacteria bacterium]HRA99263.1 hypothetical protein [Ignavibacteria bacterium]
MDLEKTKNSYKWDPASGDYSKSYVSYERKISNKKQSRKSLLTIIFILAIIVSIVVIFIEFS